MLPTGSPQGLFIVGTVEFVLSGLILAVLVWLTWKEPARRRQWTGWIVAFVFLVLSFGVGAWTSYRLLVESQALTSAPLYYAGSRLLETGGLAVLAWAVLSRIWRTPAALCWVAVAVELAVLLFRGPSPGYLPSLLHTASATAVSIFAFVGIVVRARQELRFAGAAFLLLALANISVALDTVGVWEASAWNLASLLSVLGLAGFALSVDRSSHDLFVQVFVRLNLVFIFLAGVLMALASQAEQTRRTDFARSELEELAEFLRGRVVSQMEYGEQSGNILSNQGIVRRITSDFDQHPDLRAVRIRLREWELLVSTDEDGTVSQQLRESRNTASTGSAGSPTAVAAEWPIIFEERPVGAIVFAETQRSVNRDLAGSLLVIFVAFTSAVPVASLLIGMIVYGASERLRQQVQQIEQSERQLMQAAKLASLGELVSGVAHEINNPLGVILSRTEYQQELVKQDAARDELAEDLGVINRQAHRITRIVQDLLSFARPHPMELQRITPTDVIRRPLALAAAHLRDARVQPSVELPADLPTIWADPDRLQQVFINLINNAVDAMPDGGELRIRARKQENHVLLSMADTGVGIPEENLKRVFDPFFSTKEGKGTGLGLSISYGIVRDHGGRIWAESQPGQGSTFFISLPAEVGGDRSS